MALSAVTGLGESGEPGTGSPSKEKYPLDGRRREGNIDILRNTSKSAGVLGEQSADSGSPPAAHGSLAGIERAVRAEPRVAPTDGGSPPLPPSVDVTPGEPSGRFGGLLEEQSGTVRVDWHLPKQPTASGLCGIWSCAALNIPQLYHFTTAEHFGLMPSCSVPILDFYFSQMHIAGDSSAQCLVCSCCIQALDQSFLSKLTFSVVSSETADYDESLFHFMREKFSNPT